MRNPFRLRSKNLFLIFSKVDASISLQNVKAQIDVKPSLEYKDFIIGKELDEHGNAYFNIALSSKLKTIFEIRGSSKIDLVFKGKSYYANWSTIKHYPETVEYACKTGE